MDTDNHRLRLLKGLSLLMAVPFFVSPVQAQDAAANEAEEAIEEIIITGSRIPRAGFDTMLPAIVIDSEFLNDRGFTDVASALNEIPAFGVPGNSTQGDQSIYSVGQNFVNFFGIGSQRTLTLVNGRRFVSSNSPSLFVGANAGLQVDLNMIPSSLIDRIETIAVGGAPIYGADAIAGTVNVIMKQDFEGLEFRGSYGASDANEMEETSLSIVWGANSADGRGNVVLSIEHSDREGMIEADMAHFDVGWQFRDTGDATYDLTLIRKGTANIVSANGVITPGEFVLPNLGIGAWGDGSFLQFSPDGSLVPYDVGIAVDNAVWSIGGDGLFLPDVTGLFTPLDRTIGTAFAYYEISPGVEVFGEFWAVESQAVQLVSQSSYQSGLFSQESFSLRFPIDHPLLTQAAMDTLAALTQWVEDPADPDNQILVPVTDFSLQRANRDLQPDGNQDHADTSLFRTVIGLRGDFSAGERDFLWDVSYNRGRTVSTASRTDLSSQRFFYALDVIEDPANPGTLGCRVTLDPSSRPVDPGTTFGTAQQTADFDDCVPLDIFGAGRASQAALDYIGVSEIAETTIKQEVWEANISTDLFEMPGGSFGVAAGISSRTETAFFGNSGFSELGLGRSTPINPVGGEYTSDEIYIEFLAPLVSEDMDIPLMSMLTLEGAFRTMDNDIAGKDEAWTVGLRYAPIYDLEFRGNVTKSVRAPAITELFLPLSGLSTFASDPCDGTFVNEGPDPAARKANCIAGGNGLPGIPDPDNYVASVRNASVNGVTGGNLDLENEQADAWTVGIVYVPRFIDGLRIAIDYVDIDIQEAIESFSLTDIMRACYDAEDFPNNTFCTNFRRNPNGQIPPNDAFVSGFVNAGQRTFKGYTMEVLYVMDAWAGQFDFNASLINIQEDTRVVLGSGTDFAGEIGQAEWQANLMFRYSQDMWSTFLQPRFIGKALWDNDASENRYSIAGSKDVWILNGGFHYDINDLIRLQLNINNLFDDLPSPGALATGNDGVYDNIGRFYRVGFQISF